MKQENLNANPASASGAGFFAERFDAIGIGLLLAGGLRVGYRLGCWWQHLQLEEVARRAS